MKQDRLESFVNENRHEFDRLEPSDHTWDAISIRLKEKTFDSRKFIWLKVAAIVAVVLLSAVIVYQQRFSERRQEARALQSDPELRELIEAEAYYSQEVNVRMTEIKKCYKIHPEVKSEVESDLNELEKMYLSLKSDLKENISNKEVIEAMIENNRVRLKLVDDVLEQINC